MPGASPICALRPVHSAAGSRCGARRHRRDRGRLHPGRSGPPLVMLHGAPATAARGNGCSPTSHETTRSSPGTRRASASRRTSTRPGGRAQFADALAGFIAALGLERPHLVGHSFGTMVTLSLFDRHPAVPASLVLIGGYADGRGRCRLARWHDGGRCSSAWPTSAIRSTRSPTRACSRTSSRPTATGVGLDVA